MRAPSACRWVWRARRQPEAAEDLGALGRRPEDFHRADFRAHARIDREDNRGALGVVPDLRTRS